LVGLVIYLVSHLVSQFVCMPVCQSVSYPARCLVVRPVGRSFGWLVIWENISWWSY